jgi:hypothetical protein
LQSTSIVGIIPASNISTVNFSNVGGTLTIASGGTGATNEGGARTNLGLGSTWLTNTNVNNFRTDIGLGNTNSVTFSEVTVTNTFYPPTFSPTNLFLGAGSLRMTGSSSTTRLVYKLLGVSPADRTVLAAEDNLANLGSAATARTNLGLGATWLTNSTASGFRSAIELSGTWLTNTNEFNFRTGIGLGTNSIVTFGGITNNGNIIINQTNSNNGLLFIYRTNNEPFLGLANLIASNNTTLSNETLFRVGLAEQTNKSAQFGFRVVRTNNGGEGFATFSVFGYNALMMIGPSDRSRLNTNANAAIEADIYSINPTNKVMTLITTNTGATLFHRPIDFSSAQHAATTRSNLGIVGTGGGGTTLPYTFSDNLSTLWNATNSTEARSAIGLGATWLTNNNAINISRGVTATNTNTGEVLTGGTNGSLFMKGGDAVAYSSAIEPGGNAGYINLNGAPGGDGDGGDGGYINLSAGTDDGHGGSIDLRGDQYSRGGSIISTGTDFGGVNGGTLNMSAGDIPGGGNRSGGSITTMSGGGSIDTTGTGTIELGISNTRTTFVGSATTNRSISLPDASGTIALTNTLGSWALTTDASTARTNLGLGATWLTNTTRQEFQNDIFTTNEAIYTGGPTIFSVVASWVSGTWEFRMPLNVIDPVGVGLPSYKAQTRTNLGLGATWLTNSTAPLFWASVPASPTNSGTAGQIAYTNNFLYICISNNTWRRVQLGTW